MEEKSVLGKGTRTKGTTAALARLRSKAYSWHELQLKPVIREPHTDRVRPQATGVALYVMRGYRF